MTIDLLNLPGGPVSFEFRLKPEEADLEGEDVRFRGDVSVKGEIEEAEGRYIVRGTIDSEQSLDCSRCLEPIDTRSTIQFDVGYIPADTEVLENDHEVGLDDLDIGILKGNELNLNELARE